MKLELNNLLNEEECSLFLKLITGKKPNSPFNSDGSMNFYSRYKVENIDIQKKLEEYLFSKYNISYSLIKSHFWINEVTPKGNKNDDYHLDDSPLTIITFLNDDFEGGEFEYIDGIEKITIKPVKNKSILLTGDIHHRVLPVTSGVRHSLIGAFNLPAKKTFSLL